MPGSDKNSEAASGSKNERSSLVTSPVIASQLAAAISTLLLHPLDVVRTRFMSQDSTPERRHSGRTYRRVWEAVRTMYRLEGVSALYRGWHVSLVGSVCAWGVYMWFYKTFSTALTHQGESDSFLRGDAAPFIASVMASVSSAVMCNPIWLMKTRLELAERIPHTASSSLVLASPTARMSENFLSLRRGVRYTARVSGWQAFWRGTSAQILLGIPNAMTLPLYEGILRRVARGEGDGHRTADVLFSSAVSKTVVCVLSHPLLLVKVRLQDHRAREGAVRYVGAIQTLCTCLRMQGFQGLCRGMGSSVLHTVPRAVVFYVLYEHFLAAVL